MVPLKKNKKKLLIGCYQHDENKIGELMKLHLTRPRDSFVIGSTHNKVLSWSIFPLSIFFSLAAVTRAEDAVHVRAQASKNNLRACSHRKI